MQSTLNIDLIELPFDGYARTGHQDAAASALRRAGLLDALARHTVHTDRTLRLPAFEAHRGPHAGLLNELAVFAMADQLHTHVVASTRAGHFPLVVGGDCTLLLGVVPGLRDALGQTGLLFVDGHEDTMPLDVVEDGEAANCEIGLLLGLTGQLLTGPLARRLPALTLETLAILGQHDASWRERFNIGSLANLGVWSRTFDEVAPEPRGVGRAAAEHLAAAAGRWWVHVDLDVLSPDVFRSRDLPEPPEPPVGLDWAQLDDLLMAAADVPGCVGASITIYDPAHDEDGHDARQVAALSGRLVDTVASARPTG